MQVRGALVELLGMPSEPLVDRDAARHPVEEVLPMTPARREIPTYL